MKVIDATDELISDIYTAWQLASPEVGSYDMRFSEMELEIMMSALIQFKLRWEEKHNAEETDDRK